MDPEPGRCRRTDGKRWRCSRSVVAEQKYCERHMHRGRQLSRWTPEDIVSDTRSSLQSVNSTKSTNSKTKTKTNNPTNTDSQVPSLASSDTRHSAPITVDMTSTSSTSARKASKNVNINLSGTPTIFMSYDNIIEANHNLRADVHKTKSACIASSSTKLAVANHGTGGGRNYIDGKDVGFNDDKARLISSITHGKEGNVGGFHRPVYGLSPKSVLQGARGSSCRSSVSDYKNVTETEAQRCRRTDGKRWRCSNNVILGQKYCQKHMHRGAKRAAEISTLESVIAAAPAASSNSPFFIAKRVNNCLELNTEPSSMNADNSTSSSSSDATTITD